ncbi:hypothetical protein Tco_0826033 [Tanacetum coccineum]
MIDAGLFHGINIGGSVTLSHMFYADDAVFVGEWNDNNITSLIHALDWFHKVSGLNINLSKSKIMGIGVENDKVSLAARKLGCLVLNTPFLYLGSYVGGNMHRLQSWDNIVERVRSHHIGCRSDVVLSIVTVNARSKRRTSNALRASGVVPYALN